MKRRRLVIALIVLMAACVILDFYTRLPATFDVAPLYLDPATHSVVLLFHGRLGENEPTLLALDEKLRLLARAQPDTSALLYVWAPYSDPRFRSQANGEHIGEALGAELATLPKLESVHLIGQSSGAFLLDPICETYRKAGGRARIVITYLDPMGFRGGFDPWWGSRHYGACADYAEAFINTDDWAMGTNYVLRNAWNVDVTASAKPAGYADGGHRWPMRYYLDQLSERDLLGEGFDQRERPRGAVVRR